MLRSAALPLLGLSLLTSARGAFAHTIYVAADNHTD